MVVELQVRSSVPGLQKGHTCISRYRYLFLSSESPSGRTVGGRAAEGGSLNSILIVAVSRQSPYMKPFLGFPLTVKSDETV